MFRTKRLLLIGGLSLAVATAGGCSFLVTFDETERPCGEDSSDPDSLGDCLDGFSCMVNVCVANNSVPEGITCSVNAHCETGHVCTTAPFVCRADCGNVAYGDNTACSASRACVRKVDPDNQPAGACVPTECTTASDCPDPEGIATATCVSVTANTGVCEQACSVSCNAGNCGGNCGFDDDRNPLACQPLGRDQVLACIPEGLRQHGDPCNFVNNPCTGNSACVMATDGSFGVCLAYCDSSADPTTACGSLIDPASDTAATCNVIAGKGFAICGTLPAGPIGGDDGPPGGDPGAGDPVPAGGKTCQERCSGTPDCNTDYECQSNRCVYTGTTSTCSDDNDCITLYTGWFTSCSTDAECVASFMGDHCVDLNGAGWCARASPATDCSTFMQLTETMQKLEDGTNVDVCADLSVTCNAGICDDFCTDSIECSGETPHCSTTTNHCECQSNGECAGEGRRTICSGGVCVCGGADECVADTGFYYKGDICTGEPDCGCDTDLDCVDAKRTHPSTTWVCE